MAWGDIQGKAVTSPSSPRAKAVCDSCGTWYQLRNLIKQDQWMGPRLAWTGQLVCRRCYCKPQPQLRPIALPPDPVPVLNPRPEAFLQDSGLLGFTEYVMWADGQPLDYTVVLTDGEGNPILYGGQPIILEIGHDGPALLSQLAAMTGIPVPGNIQIYNGTLAAAGVAQTLVPASPTRSYIAIFNPCSAPIGVCTAIAPAELGVAPTINLGPGNCLFWATQQNLGTPYAGVMTVVGSFANVPYYAYAN